MLVDRLTYLYNTTIRMDHQLRVMFYRIVSAQLSAGRSPLNCCESLLGLADVEPPVRELARKGVAAAKTGKLVSSGWLEANVLPRFDSRLLNHGESSDTLNDALEQLITQSTEKVSLIHDVLKPIWFQILLLLVTIGMVTNSHLWVEMLVSEDSARHQLLLWNVSMAFQSYCVPLVLVLLSWFALVAFGRPRWTGESRNLLTPFDKDWRYQLGANYCRIANLLHRNGANHMTVANAFKDVYDHIPFVNKVIPAIQADLRDGRHYADALAGRVLPSDQARLIKSLSPSESLDQFAQAFRVVGESMHALLKRRYQRWLSLIRVLVLTGCATLILVLIFGMYDVTSVMATTMTGY